MGGLSGLVKGANRSGYGIFCRAQIAGLIHIFAALGGQTTPHLMGQSVSSKKGAGN